MPDSLFEKKVLTDRRTNRPTDRPTNQRTDRPFYRDAWTHIKGTPGFLSVPGSPVLDDEAEIDDTHEKIFSKPTFQNLFNAKKAINTTKSVTTGWAGGQTEGLMDGQMDERTDGRVDG